MDLNLMMIFAKVAEHQSFTKAAKELLLEKSTVSNKISQLEKQLGVRLLNRTTRLVSITEAGDAYYQYCRQIMDIAGEAERFSCSLSDKPQGILRLTAPSDFALLLMSQLIKPYIKKYPNVKIDLIVLDREVDLIAERFDIALRIGQDTLKDSSLIGKKLFDVTLGLYAAPEFLTEYGIPKTTDELQNYPLIIFTKQKINDFKFWPSFFPDDFNTKSQLKINDILTCKESAISGLGIAILPDSITKLDVKLNRLIKIESVFSPPSVTLFAAYPSRLYLPPKVKEFLRLLEIWSNEIDDT